MQPEGFSVGMRDQQMKNINSESTERKKCESLLFPLHRGSASDSDNQYRVITN